MSTLNHDITRSSMLSHMEYDPEKKELVLTFSKGGMYKYFDVPKAIYDGLLGADSIGKYFLAAIKSRFEEEKL